MGKDAALEALVRRVAGEIQVNFQCSTRARARGEAGACVDQGSLWRKRRGSNVQLNVVCFRRQRKASNESGTRFEKPRDTA